jgi:biopolymer transport protein ExbD
MRISPPTESSRSELSVVPLVNVVFLLLVFFMLVGQVTSPDSLDIEPPRSVIGKDDPGQTVRILLARDGRLALERVVVSESELSDRVSGIVASQPTATFQIKADARIDAVRMIGVMERLQAAGVKELTLLTEERRTP